MIMQLPSASALGMVQFGTIAGKLKGTMDATTPTATALRPAFHSLADFQHLTGHQLGQGSGKLGKLDTFFDLGHRLAARLAVLFADQCGQFIEMLLQ